MAHITHAPSLSLSTHTHTHTHTHTSIIRKTSKWSRYRSGVAQRVGRGIALLLHDRGTRRGWVVRVTHRPLFTPGEDPVPILQEGGWAPGPVWTGGKSRPHRNSIPNRPARSQSLYRLSYPTHTYTYNINIYIYILCVHTHAHTHTHIWRQTFRPMCSVMWRSVIRFVVSDVSTHPKKLGVHHHSSDNLKPRSKMSAKLYDIYHCRVYSEKLLVMDRGTVRNI